MKKNLAFTLLKALSVFVVALLALTVFCSRSTAQSVPPYEYNTSRVEYREYGDNRDHSRLAFTLKEVGTEGPTVPSDGPLISGLTTVSYKQSETDDYMPIIWHSPGFYVSEVAYGRYNEVLQRWDYDTSLETEYYYRVKLYPQDPSQPPDYSKPFDPARFPIARAGFYKIDAFFENPPPPPGIPPGIPTQNDPLTAEIYFPGPNWQPRPIINDIYFDDDGNLIVENSWADDDPPVGFDEGSEFVVSLSNENYSKSIGAYMPTTMTQVFIPAETLALIGFEGNQQFYIQMHSRTGDGTTRVYGQTLPIIPNTLPGGDGPAMKSFCEIPILGDGAGLDVFYDRRNYDPLMVSEPTGGIKFGVYIGNYPDVETRDLVASKFQQVIFQNTTNGSGYRMTAPELYKWKESFSGEFSLFAGHPSMVIGDWIAKIRYDSQWYEATFTITPQMLEQTPPIPVPRVRVRWRNPFPRVRVRWQNPFNPCDSGIKIIAPATNGEQYRLRIFDEFGGLVVEDNMRVVNILGKKFIVHRYNRADVLGKRARIETRHFDTDWLTILDWSTWPPNCNANGLFPGSMARSVTWFETPPPRDPSCGGGTLAPLE
jgi:hypothetical protein